MMAGGKVVGPCSEDSEIIEQGPFSAFAERDEFVASLRKA